MKTIRHFAAGGILGASPVDPNGSDFDAINAEKTQRWAAEDAAAKVRTTGVSALALPLGGLTVSPFGSATVSGGQAETVVQPSSFEQDADARQSRITGYAARLKEMEANGRANGLIGVSSTITRGFAEGGKIDPDELMRQMSAKYGPPAAGPVPQQPAAQPAPPPSQQQQPKPQQGLGSGIVGVLKGRAAQIDKAAGYANGKSPDSRPSGAAMASLGLSAGFGGKIDGPGTPTSDSIPASVRETGEAIRVSTQERILSKSQDAFLEEIAQASGFESLNAMLEAGTGQQVGPTIKADKRAAATGMAPEPDQPPQALGIDSRIAAAIAAPPTLGGGSPVRTEPAGGGLTKAAQAAGYRPEINGITWSDKGFDPTAQQMTPGTGAIAVRSGPNAGKNIAIGTQNYTAADGSSTSDWSKTAQYAQGVAQAKKDRETLAMMQRDRLERDAYSAEITDPRLQINARQQLHDIDAKATKEGETYGRMLDNQTKLAKLNSDGQMAGLQAQYLAETDQGRREALAERIRGVQGKGAAPVPVNLQHLETDGGTMVFNPRTGRMTPAVGVDGQPVGSGKALTEFQGKSTSYGMRAEAASKVIEQVGQGGKVQPSLIKRGAEAVPLVGEGLGMVANIFASPEQQQIEQAQRDFVNAALRQESGAAISASEFDNARKQYFPQPNDTPEVIDQKQRNREATINGFRISAGPGARNIGGAPAQPQQQQPSAAPKVGTVDGKHVFLGGNPADPASWAEVR